MPAVMEAIDRMTVREARDDRLSRVVHFGGRERPLQLARKGFDR